MRISGIDPRPVRPLVILFLLSLLIRLLFLGLMTGNDAAETGRDAQGYYNRAVGVEFTLGSLSSGQLPSSVDLARAFSSSWPPLQSLILGIGFLFFGHGLFVGRIIMVVLSAVTTPMVFLVTQDFSNRRAALWAAGIHALYPSFIHYSLRLFSETTFVFVLFLLLLVVLRLPHAKSLKGVVLFAAMAGLLLGLGTLVRAMTLAWIPVVGLWAGRQVIGYRSKLLTGILVLGVAGLALLPWEALVYAREGRVVLVTRAADVSAYLAKHFQFQIPIFGQEASSDKTDARIVDEAKTERQAGVRTAFEVPSPLRQLARMWNPDFTLFRYLLILGYMPLDPTLVGLLILLMVVCFVAFIVFALWGLWLAFPSLQHRWLIIGLLLAASLLHAVTFGQSRYSIPLLALLLPAAGHSLAHGNVLFGKANRLRTACMFASCVVLSVVIYSGVPYEYGTLAPSSHYASLIRRMDAVLEQETLVSDRLVLRVVGDQFPEKISIAAEQSEHEFADEVAVPTDWSPTEQGELHLQIRSRLAEEPLVVTISDSKHSARITLTPASWHTWMPSGLPGVEYQWLGSGGYRISNLAPEIRGY